MEVIEGETLTKVCTKCGIEKELEGFYRDKRGKFGRESKCKECRAEYYRKWWEENREAQLEYKRKWREENPEHRRKYHEENPHVSREAARRRRSRKRENGVEFYRDEDIYDRDNWICQLCGKPIDPNAEHRNEDGSLNLWYKNIDHIIPISKGGADAPHNVQASHFRCNVSKSNRIENDNDISRA